jgi:hypothetical protein
MLRISIRVVKRRGRRIEKAYFYNSPRSSIFNAKCGKDRIHSFIEMLGKSYRWSRSGRTLYIDGEDPDAKNTFKILLIFSAITQCTRETSKIPWIAEAVAKLGEFATLFWYSRFVEEYEERGFWGVCRAAKAFRILYRIY